MTRAATKPGWTRKVPHAPDCPKEDLHTLQPEGYLPWHDWAEKHQQTHAQLRCPGCGLYTIWVKKDTGSLPPGAPG